MSRLKHVFIFVLAALYAVTGVLAVVGAAQAAPAVVSGPVSAKWYFAEGRVGSGFRQWLSIDNSSDTACRVKIQEFYTMDGTSSSHTKMSYATVNPQTRYSHSVNNDLGIPQNGTGATLSAQVEVDQGATPSCTGVVVERPMYFVGYHGVSSGTNILGASVLQNTYYFADIPTGTAGNCFLSLFNPGDNVAHVQANYYVGGALVKTETVDVLPNSRGTLFPGDQHLPAHVGAIINADRAIFVERPSYFTSSYGFAGSANVTGAAALSKSWYFAGGSTANGVQENLTLANLGSEDANVTITLKSLSGTTKDYKVLVKAMDQLIWSVNDNNSYPGSTPETAIEVQSDAGSIVAQRETFSAAGITDTLGAPVAKTSYSFAEGYTANGFGELLALQNPNEADITVSVVLVNMLGHKATKDIKVTANSRATVNIAALVKDQLINNGDGINAYAVSMSVSSVSPFVAERSMSWSGFFGTSGSTSIVGYAGN